MNPEPKDYLEKALIDWELIVLELLFPAYATASAISQT